MLQSYKIRHLNKLRHSINLPISAAAMMLKMVEAVIILLMTITMSHFTLIILMIIMKTVIGSLRNHDGYGDENVTSN